MRSLQGKLLRVVRWSFLAGILALAGFVSCLTAMRFAIRGSEVTVPDLMGRTVRDADRLVALSQLQLELESHRFDERVESDHIVAQAPTPGSKLKRNRSVRVIVSLGARKIPVPDLKGESLRTTQIALLSRGFTLGVTSIISSTEIEKDRVIAQDPLPLTPLARSPRVSVLVSGGASGRDYLMPSVTGNTLDEISEAIQNTNLKVGTVTYRAIPGVLKGTILHQTPAAGFKLPEGTVIDLEVSR
jgi:eukaryotic-like serine/threonine-protein kinase